MMDAGESLWDPYVLRGAGGPPHPISDFRAAGGVANVEAAHWIILGKPSKGSVCGLLECPELHRGLITNYLIYWMSSVG